MSEADGVKRTALAGCAIISEGKLLLLWKTEHGHYEFPGGGVEPGESFEETALREMKEETGCEVTLVKPLGAFDFSKEEKEGEKGYRCHLFLAKLKPGEEPRIMEPAEFRNLIWMPLSDHMRYELASNVRRFCESYAARGRERHG